MCPPPPSHPHPTSDLLSLFLVEHGQGVQFLSYQEVSLAQTSLVYLQGLFVQRLCRRKLPLLGMQACHLVEALGDSGMIWIEGRLPDFQSTLQGGESLE